MALDFVINLGGTFAAGLDKANEKLDGTDKGAKKAKDALNLFEGEVGKLSASFGGLKIDFAALSEGGHFFTFDLAEGLKIGAELVASLAEKFVDLGSEIVHAVAGIDDLNLAIKLNVGAEGSEQVDKLAESFKGTRFDDKDIKAALLPLLEESGMKQSAMFDALITASTDVATRRNTGAAGAAQALGALRDIELNPQKMRGALKELAIKQVDFYADLGDLLGISAKTAEAQTKAGKIQSETLLSVALNQIAKREGGELGNATNEGAKTLGSTLTRLGNLKENIFEQLAGSQGMQAIQGFLDNFITTMEGPIGTDLVRKVGGAFETLFGDLSGPDGLSKMKDVVGGIATSVGNFVDNFRAIWPEIQADFAAAMPVFQKFAEILGGIARVMGALPRIGEAVGNFLADYDFGVGPEERAAMQRSRMAGNVIERMGSETVAANTDAHAWAGSMVPAMADGGIVDRPTLALVGEAGPEAVVPLSKMGSFGMGDVHLHIAGGAAAGSPESIARAVRVELQAMIAEVSTARGAA